MTVKAIGKYEFEPRDAEKNFDGRRVTYWHWTDHLMFCAPLAFPLPPGMPLGAVIREVLPTFYGLHPEWAKIDWQTARFSIDHKPVTPNFDASLDDHGIRHKSLVEIATPGLTGIRGSCS